MLRLIHGWGLNGHVFQGFRAALGGPSEAVDLPGHGKASFAPGALHPETLAQSLALRYPEPSAWLGWSLGGLVALVLAARHPECVTKLILVGTTPSFKAAPDWPWGMAPEILEAFASQLAHDYEATLRRFLTLQAGVGERAQVQALMAHLRIGGAAQAPALAEGLAVLSHCDRRDLLSVVRAPTLFIHGTDDKVVSLKAARASAEQMPHARVCEMGRGHAPFLSHEAQCAEVVRDFLNE